MYCNMDVNEIVFLKLSLFLYISIINLLFLDRIMLFSQKYSIKYIKRIINIMAVVIDSHKKRRIYFVEKYKNSYKR